MPVRYKVAELQSVTAEDLEACISAAGADGWQLDHIDYVKEAGVRRPQMAFVFFTRSDSDGEAPE